MSPSNGNLGIQLLTTSSQFVIHFLDIRIQQTHDFYLNMTMQKSSFETYMTLILENMSNTFEHKPYTYRIKNTFHTMNINYIWHILNFTCISFVCIFCTYNSIISYNYVFLQHYVYNIQHS